MRKTWYLGLALLLIGTLLQAGSYTVTTVGTIDAVLTRAMSEENASRPPATRFPGLPQFVNFLCDVKFQATREVQEAADQATIQSSFCRASVAAKNSVCANLGLPVGCGHCR